MKTKKFWAIGRPKTFSILQAGGKGVEPLHTDPESAVLPLDEPPIINGCDFTMPITSRPDWHWLSDNYYILSSSSAAALIRWRTFSRPMISMQSKIGGLFF